MVNYSLSSACDIENFSGMEIKDGMQDPKSYQQPVMPMPTNPPNFEVNIDGENYKWKSMNSAITSMTEPNSFDTYKPVTDQGTRDLERTNFANEISPQMNAKFPPPSNEFMNDPNKKVCNQVRKEWSNPVPPGLRDEYEAKLNKVEPQLKYPIEYSKEDTVDTPPVFRKKKNIQENYSQNVNYEKKKPKKTEMSAIYMILIVFIVVFVSMYFYRNMRS